MEPFFEPSGAKVIGTTNNWGNNSVTWIFRTAFTILTFIHRTTVNPARETSKKLAADYTWSLAANCIGWGAIECPLFHHDMEGSSLWLKTGTPVQVITTRTGVTKRLFHRCNLDFTHGVFAPRGIVAGVFGCKAGASRVSQVNGGRRAADFVE